MTKFVVTDTFERDGLAKALCDYAAIDPRYVRRMVIDLQAGSAGMVYIEMFADRAILDVSIAELGVRIQEADQ